MTTTTHKTGTALRDAATALRDAELAIDHDDDTAAHEALLALARASYQSLASFEVRAVQPAAPPRLCRRG